MIICPVCNTPNHHLKITCVSCGSYIQQKVDNLNLFELLWKIIETPQKALKTVALAKHKNYSFLLGAFFGIGLIFFCFWIMKVAEVVQEFIIILSAGLFMGPVAGIIFLLLATAILNIIFRISGERSTFRNSMAVTAYSLIPVVFSTVFILPLELITFGIYLFTKEPGIWILKPFAVILLFGLDGIAILWTIVLNIIGMKTLYDTSWQKTTMLVFLSLIVISAMVSMILTPFIVR